MVGGGPPHHKLVILGGSRVGRSALATQFVMNCFVENIDPNIEELYRKLCLIDERITYLEIFDPAGSQDGFETPMVGEEIRNAEGFLLVYSITSRESFEEIVTNYQQILRSKKKGRFSAILVANKCDLEERREVSTHEGQELARYLGCTFTETSAKSGTKVDETFANLVREIRKREPDFPVTYSQPAPASSDRCSCGCRGGCLIV